MPLLYFFEHVDFSEPVRIYHQGDRLDVAQREDFIANEVKRLFRPLRQVNNPDIFPWTSVHREVLHIPIADVRDLALYLFLFILYRICEYYNESVHNDNATVLFSLFTEEDAAQDHEMGVEQIRYTVDNIYTHEPALLPQSVGGRTRRSKNALVPMRVVQSIYDTILRSIGALLPGGVLNTLAMNNETLTWNGSDYSGTRIRLLNYLGTHLCLRLFFNSLRSQRRGGRWTQAIENILQAKLGTCIKSVRNKQDDMCLLYCIVIGLILKVKRNGFRAFDTRTMMLEPSEIFAKAQCLAVASDDEYDVAVCRLVQNLGLLLNVPPAAAIFYNHTDEDVDDEDEPAVPSAVPLDLDEMLDVDEEQPAVLNVEAFLARHSIHRPERPALTPPNMLQQFVIDLDKKVGTMTSIPKFREDFSEIEDMLLPLNSGVIIGIDVYGIDYNVNPHVYPLYFSSRRAKYKDDKIKILELLCVTPPDSATSHYCLIINSEKLFRLSGGKQFFSCSKCGQCFYHRKLLQSHQCPYAIARNGDVNAIPSTLIDPTINETAAKKEGGYHYSNAYVDPAIDDVVGSCPKCRLWFTDRFRYEYHMEHCLMDGISGYRHVQLVEYNPASLPMLKGVELDEEYEDKHVADKHMMYADFECSINPESGIHTFMSYGIYDWDTEEYQCGYTMEDFFTFVLDRAFGRAEQHTFIFFHNAMGYDANFILKHVLRTKEYELWGINVIMKSTNKLQKLVFYATRGEGEELQRRTIHICDSFLFLTLSLERIVQSIRKDDLEENKKNFATFFEVMKGRYPWVPDEEVDHILRKNIFPYKFFTDSSKLEVDIRDFASIFDPKQPENVKYFSERVTLGDLERTYEDNIHVLTEFRCKNTKDYHDLYLCCDVMQLADLFNRAMDILWDSHKIHLTRYIGMPSASWAAFLRHDPKMEIPLYVDTFYAEFFKSMIRGGITSAAKRYAKADIEHSIIYVDVNGLYPYVMQQYAFPCGEFKFEPRIHWDESEAATNLPKLFNDLAASGNKGMCFCVDLHIPDDVKDLTDMYPFAPEHRAIYREYYDDANENAEETGKTLKPFLKRWSDANEGGKMNEFNGLVCTLYDKEKYNVHWRLLRFYMEHGIQVKKVWFAVSFDEGFYLKGYVSKNIEIRNTRKDELGKTLYKLLGNSIYGKTFESPFKRNTFMIVRDKTKLQGMLEEGNLAAILPIEDLGWVVRMDGEDIILDKPTFIGACVCEFAKLHMYELLYDHMAHIFPDRHVGRTLERGCEMLYTDTDSFILRVRHPPELMTRIKEEDLEKDHIDPALLFGYIKEKNPALLGGIGGQIKSETGEQDFIKEFVGLRSKVYAYKTLKGKIDKRAKGTTHDAQEMQLNWETYMRALTSLENVETHNMQFERAKFGIRTIDRVKISLSVNDGKRDIMSDGIHTHAFGFYERDDPSTLSE